MPERCWKKLVWKCSPLPWTERKRRRGRKEPKFVLNIWQTGQEGLDPTTARSAWELQAFVVIVEADHLHLVNRQLLSMLHPWVSSPPKRRKVPAEDPSPVGTSFVGFIKSQTSLNESRSLVLFLFGFPRVDIKNGRGPPLPDQPPPPWRLWAEPHVSLCHTTGTPGLYRPGLLSLSWMGNMGVWLWISLNHLPVYGK